MKRALYLLEECRGQKTKGDAVSGHLDRPGRKSGPGQMKRLASVRTTHDRSSSSPRRRFVSAGISIAVVALVRRRVGDRKNCDGLVTVFFIGGDQDDRAGTILDAFFLAFEVLFTPEIAVPDDKSRSRFGEGHAISVSVRG